MLIQLEEDFEKCIEELDFHTKDVPESKPQTNLKGNINEYLKCKEMDFENDAHYYFLSDRNDIACNLPLKRVFVQPNMHCTLPSISNQKKREKK